MIKKIVIIMLLLAMLMPVASANDTYAEVIAIDGDDTIDSSISPIPSSDIVNDLKIKVDEYNAGYADKVPSLLNNVLGNEVIKLVISANDGSYIYIKAITESSYVTTFEVVDADTEIGETTTITTNEATVREVMNSEDPMGAFLSAKSSGDIVIESDSITTSFMFSVLGILQSLGFI